MPKNINYTKILKMNLEARKVIVNKSATELTELLKQPQEYRQLMPDSIQKFESNESGFVFGLKGMPEVSLKINEIVDNEKVVLKSGSSALDFSLVGTMNSISKNQTEVQLLFEGNFNTFIKMMVEKPLQNFLNTLTDKLELL